MLAFTHIPKTAGTTLNYILKKNFGSKLHSIQIRKGSNYTYNDFKKDKRIYRNAKCISGHGLKPFINYKEFNNELQWFTFLRDPIKRYISQYIHQQTSKLKQYHMPIEEWGEKFTRSNWQVKWIAGEEDLEAAKQIIQEKFVFVGITEKFDESLKLLRNSLQVNLDISYTNSKMVVRDNGLKKELIKRGKDDLFDFFTDQNKLDIELYDFIIKQISIPQKDNSLNKENKFSFNNWAIKSRVNIINYNFKTRMIYKPYVYITK